jgi:hypothetical protein
VLALPYVTAAAFRAHPTYLDLLNLRSQDPNLADQSAELFNVLLMASREADNYLEFGEPDGTLAAHVKTENKQLIVGRDGLLRFHPAHKPVVSVASIAYGTTFSNSLTVVQNPTVWIEGGANIVADLGRNVTYCSGWPQPFTRTRLYTTWIYTAGYVNTLLGATATAGATSITVTDPTGITGGTANTPATSLRIWDPGAEETVTVASTYVDGSTTVPLTGALVGTHTFSAASPIGVSALPAELHLAITQWATALLLRPSSKSTSQFKGSPMKLSTAGDDDAYGDASGLVKAAKEALEPYHRIR